MRTAPAIINPDILIWARETIGLEKEEWAAKSKKTVEQIEAWESGDEKMTIAQLRSFSNLVKRPLATFYLNKRPDDNSPPKDFRGRDNLFTESFDKALIVEYRKALVRREDTLELAEELEIIPPQFSLVADMKSDPENLANDIREYLGVNDSEISKCKTNYETLNYWKDRFEQAGILVFQSTRIPFDVFRGFSISLDPIPVVVLNPADSPNGRVFTLIHEITHIVLRISALCDLVESDAIGKHEHDVEVYCNHVAGAVLVPSDRLFVELQQLEHDTGVIWSHDELQYLANIFKCSQEVILRRLLMMGQTSQQFYSDKRGEFLEKYAASKSKGESPKIPQHIKSIAANGKLFTRLVIDSYKREIITASQLSNLLSVKLRHLPSIERAISR